MISASALSVLLGLAFTVRVTRFVTADFLAAPLRVWVIEHTRPGSKLAYLVECPWCMSIWVAVPPAVLAVVWGAWSVPGWAVGVGLVCFFSQVTGLVAANWDR